MQRHIAPGLLETGFVRLSVVLQYVPVSKSSWWAGVKSGKYPQPIKLGPGTTVWRVEDIHALIQASGKAARQIFSNNKPSSNRIDSINRLELKMEKNDCDVPETWVQREDLEAAFACLMDNLLDEGLEDRISWAQEIVSSVVKGNADSPISHEFQRTSKELADAINACAREKFPDPALSEEGPLVWCPVLPDQIERAKTIKRLVAICATRLLPVNDPCIAENAANPDPLTTDPLDEAPKS